MQKRKENRLFGRKNDRQAGGGGGRNRPGRPFSVYKEKPLTNRAGDGKMDIKRLHLSVQSFFALRFLPEQENAMNDPKEKLTQNFAANLTALRTAAGMTQLDLADRLHYSDKSVSKWERGEALPDVLVLWQLAQIFGVTTDDLLREHTEKPVTVKAKSHTDTITAIVMIGIWTLSLLVFIVLWLCGRILWLVFPAALPVSLITLVVLNSIWRGGKGNLLIVSLMVASVLLLLYCIFYTHHFWQLFLLMIPAEALIWLGFRLKRHKK